MKKFVSVLMSLMLVFTSFSMVFAYDKLGPEKGTDKLGGGGAGTFAGNILAAIQFIGYAIAIGMLIYVGIKYVMASANEKADLKNAMIKYVIGAILIAGASAIAGWIVALGPKS